MSILQVLYDIFIILFVNIYTALQDYIYIVFVSLFITLAFLTFRSFWRRM